MTRFIIICSVLLSILFTSCKEYTPYLQCKVNGDTFRVETTVNGQYLNNGSFTQCYIQADGTPWDVNIRTNGNTPGTYVFSTGSGAPGLLEFYNGSQLFTSNNLSATGQIELIQVGSNLLEGYFSGEIVSGSSTLLISEGEFSARAY
ncbi:MAG: hypothetical protein N2167_07625 [Flavobacteriales bacterium]|nr:hypothetical protein [Flavobacteriales bacterium]